MRVAATGVSPPQRVGGILAAAEAQEGRRAARRARPDGGGARRPLVLRGARGRQGEAARQRRASPPVGQRS
ncbi:hypothetical protein IMCC26134_10530 [Verrucomicrobia bacterium IMCC26134]|nr:hypothetical protein IMCC26134_10530 [Verrucomicrobia bacterium IMCC26134]